MNAVKSIRYRVLYRDPQTPNFVVGGRDGKDIAGEAPPNEIVERLAIDLGPHAFDPSRTLDWLNSQDPADSSDSAVLPLNDSVQLEVVVRPQV